MFRFEADSGLINAVLRKIPNQDFLYQEGVIVGRVALPISSFTVVVVPGFDGTHVVLSIPFSEVKGDKTGKFFLSKILNVFWGTIAKQVEAAVIPRLRREGLPANTVTLERSKDRSGDVGKIKISLAAVNSWLAGRHPRLTPSVTDVCFTRGSCLIVGELASHNVPD